MVDSRVLEAQVWVNKTYKKKINDPSQFPPVLEDGITGWKTIHALTRALQWELGIEQLSDNFGDTTMAYLESADGIGEMNGGDIVQIVQCAFYCKGYSTGGMDGDWGDETTEAATQMCFDAGINSGQEIKNLTPKMLKGLFSMDAYALLPTGTEAVRSVQKWLNGRYLNFLNYYIVPADGIFSRSVQRALYIGIQFEMKLSPTAATGSFGPATRKFLEQNTIRSGQQGPLVQIFTGAMICQKVKLTSSTGGVDEDFTGFSDTFRSDTSSALISFQKFSELPQTGIGDFSTWCQLLVSTGNPDRPATAFDCSTGLTPSTAATMRAAGYQFVGRYLANKPGSTFNKMIQPGELTTIFNAGLRVFPIFQFYGGEASYFDYATGRRDGFAAHEAAVNHGLPTSTVIYFAVDFDATQAEINSNVEPYFKGVAGALARRDNKYIMGVYGSRNVCSDITDRVGARWSFVSGMSSGFSGNMGFAMPSNWSFNQIQTTRVGSLEIDRDVHKLGSDMGVGPASDTSAASIDDFIQYIRKVYELALTYRSTYGGPSMDLNEMVLNFLRSPRYTDKRWWLLLGIVDGFVYEGWLGFISWANGKIVKVERIYDPTYGVNLHVDHFAASCIGIYLKGKPLELDGTPPATGIADFVGWGGDWIQHYGLWQDALSQEPMKWYSGLEFCRARLAKTDEEIKAGRFDSTFKLRDLLEDVAGYNIGMNLRVKAPVATNIVDEITYAFKGPGRLTRYRDFYAKRFNNSPAAVKAAATSMLLRRLPTGADDSIVIYVAQSRLVTNQCENAIMAWDMPSDRLSVFCDGLVEMLVAKVEAEKRLT
ncbi:hypothetical protein N7457_003907 [Penicillium paradoxum]|uniref:uncharacterized protein n=1 Tax=Penicillium paradoxum TaxID=176176 RepID=UPI0025468697|nr:uncharacterized protein N7457_003907 [Penicillium paradoxum]KAJ5782133.1 hypothetical protein N7457_003907 [Penicillium paradoxum]